MAVLTLKYDRNNLQSMSGSAWIMMGAHEVSQDCGTPGELDRAIDRLQADLELIRKQGHLKFATTRKEQIEGWSHVRRP